MGVSDISSTLAGSAVLLQDQVGADKGKGPVREARGTCIDCLESAQLLRQTLHANVALWPTDDQLVPQRTENRKKIRNETSAWISPINALHNKIQESAKALLYIPKYTKRAYHCVKSEASSPMLRLNLFVRDIIQPKIIQPQHILSLSLSSAYNTMQTQRFARSDRKCIRVKQKMRIKQKIHSY
jgi:hypothetical protein